jgi:hypothetical protein
MPHDETLSLIYSSFSQLSSILSLSIVISGLIFPYVLINFKRPFSYAIFFTSLADFLGSIGASFGYRTGGWQCTLQSVLMLYFYPASWIWSGMLVYQLRSLLIYKKLGLAEHEMHILAWGLPLIPLLLPWSSGVMSYGTDDIVANISPCGWSGNDEVQKYVWILMVYWFLALVTFILMGWWINSVRTYFKTDAVPSDSIEYSLFRTMILYPMSMMITWLPTGIFTIFGLALFAGRVIIVPEQLIALLTTQNGTLLAFIYFLRSRRIRYHWRKLIFEGQLPKQQSAHNSRKLSADGVVSPTFQPRELSLFSEDGDGKDFDFDYSGEDSDEELLTHKVYERNSSITGPASFTRRPFNDGVQQQSVNGNRNGTIVNTFGKKSTLSDKLLTENPIFQRADSSTSNSNISNDLL